MQTHVLRKDWNGASLFTEGFPGFVESLEEGRVGEVHGEERVHVGGEHLIQELLPLNLEIECMVKTFEYFMGKQGQADKKISTLIGERFLIRELSVGATV